MFLAILLGLALSSQAPHATPVHSPAAIRERAHWTATEIPNLQIKVLTGEPAPDAVVATRLRARRKVRMPKHSHPVDEQMTVLKGSLVLETQNQPKTARHLKSGETTLLKSGVNHSVTLAAGTEVELSGKGRLVTTWVNPSAVKALKQSAVDSSSERTKMKQEQDKR